MRPTTTNALLPYLPSELIWIGELSGGRSATWPTFFRSTSVRTRMLLQYSQTVWMLLDQRKTILAPQLGQLATGWVIADGPPGLRQKTLPQPLATCFILDSYDLWSLRTETECASKSCRRTVSQSHSARGTQQKRFKQSEPCSGKVWHARCDSARRQRPVVPPVTGN